MERKSYSIYLFVLSAPGIYRFSWGCSRSLGPVAEGGLADGLQYTFEQNTAYTGYHAVL